MGFDYKPRYRLDRSPRPLLFLYAVTPTVATSSRHLYNVCFPRYYTSNPSPSYLFPFRSLPVSAGKDETPRGSRHRPPPCRGRLSRGPGTIASAKTLGRDVPCGCNPLSAPRRCGNTRILRRDRTNGAIPRRSLVAQALDGRLLPRFLSGYFTTDLLRRWFLSGVVSFCVGAVSGFRYGDSTCCVGASSGFRCGDFTFRVGLLATPPAASGPAPDSAAAISPSASGPAPDSAVAISPSASGPAPDPSAAADAPVADSPPAPDAPGAAPDADVGVAPDLATGDMPAAAPVPTAK
ncbi:hypothetical protein C4D60_Mb09t17340 [Musa balbisiana]|uniref:Uncharacterized protein n=1 Tax=Musa balbisiana TaxID=52838 RepID=A0A4S8IIF6_MUSBA|nr:hypothetical protein C4D60_Mb09t17340 [Musa balbisiana]